MDRNRRSEKPGPFASSEPKLGLRRMSAYIRLKELCGRGVE